ncbi:MAG: YraN family protein [Planctomycetes bacterium]|nr:YraN family protein [Planctomycetota bacterium]
MFNLLSLLRRKKAKLSPRQQAGRAAERAAERFLRKRGYRIFARNVAYPQGEVDLVAVEKRSGAVCFIEVRSREADGGRPQVAPEETVTEAKRRRVIRAARRFLAQQRRGPARRWEPDGPPIRFDVVAVRFEGPDRTEPDIRHYPGAFDVHGRLL